MAIKKNTKKKTTKTAKKATPKKRTAKVVKDTFYGVIGKASTNLIFGPTTKDSAEGYCCTSYGEKVVKIDATWTV